MHATVPQKVLFPRHILDGRGIPHSDFIVNSVAQIMAVVGKSGCLLMARTAGNGAVAGQNPVVKQRPAQLKPIGGKQDWFSNRTPPLGSNSGCGTSNTLSGIGVGWGGSFRACGCTMPTQIRRQRPDDEE
jgi:hypothetical protein